MKVEAAARKLQSMGVPNVLVTVGADGSRLFPERPSNSQIEGGVAAGGVLAQPRFPAARPVVDTTGAGDCFRGAFAAALAGAEESPPSDAAATFKTVLEIGAAAAAHCVTVSLQIHQPVKTKCPCVMVWFKHTTSDSRFLGVLNKISLIPRISRALRTESRRSPRATHAHKSPTKEYLQ